MEDDIQICLTVFVKKAASMLGTSYGNIKADDIDVGTSMLGTSKLMTSMLGTSMLGTSMLD